MPLAIPFKIETFDVLASTQDTLRERLERGENVHGLVVRALEQTGARGQRRRDWSAGPGGSYQTLAVRDPVPPVLNKPYAAVVVGIGLAQTLPEYGIQVGVKWPNDLYYCGKKVAGILCEYVQGHLLVGVGVNVNNPPPEGATSLRGLDVEGVSGFVLAGVQRGLELLSEPHDLPGLFAPFDVLNGQEVEIAVAGKFKRGVARGLDENGCLRLEAARGVTSVCQGEARGALRRA
ncbi:N/A [soil metagenome]